MVNLLLEVEEEQQVAPNIQSLLESVVQVAVKRAAGPEKTQIGLLITGEETIKELNLEHRGIDRTTDVLSFPLIEPGEEITQSDIDPETGEVVLGDIVISLPAAKRQAEEYGHDLNREIAYLAVHGTLHLLGFDHETEEEREAMRKVEEEVLEQAGLGRRDDGSIGT